MTAAARGLAKISLSRRLPDHSSNSVAAGVSRATGGFAAERVNTDNTESGSGSLGLADYAPAAYRRCGAAALLSSAT
jgi:hypothetical protein